MASSDLEKTNPSFVLQAVEQVAFEDRPVPELKSAHDVIVRVGWTGICGSDVHYWKEGRIGPYVVKSPMVLGHEAAGTVAAVGSAVTSVQVGDRVAMEPGVPCRRCDYCKGGQYNLCADVVFASTPPHDGTLARYYPIPADFCYKLPDHVSLEEGALVEPTAVAVHIVRQADVRPGQSVVVFGAGPVGLLCAAVARAHGAAGIVIVDIIQSKLDFAKTFVQGGGPAVETFIPSKSDSPEQNAANLRKQCSASLPSNGGGADVAIDASGAAASTQTAIHVVRNGGTFVQGGMGGDEITFPIMAVCSKELTVKGSFRYKQGDYGLAVALISRGTLTNVRQLVSKTVAFEQAEDAFREVSKGQVVKILIEGPK